jgi:hypothetical protein
MTPDQPPHWPEHELQYVQDELAKEYANISTAVISMVVALAQSVVPPEAGRVKLLAVARQNLGRQP